MNTVKKPPIGLKPKFINDEQRLNEVRGAISRYYEAELKIPIDWIKEYNDLIDIVYKKRTIKKGN
jgi:hypothetical protein